MTSTTDKSYPCNTIAEIAAIPADVRPRFITQLPFLLDSLNDMRADPALAHEIADEIIAEKTLTGWRRFLPKWLVRRAIVIGMTKHPKINWVDDDIQQATVNLLQEEGVTLTSRLLRGEPLKPQPEPEQTMAGAGMSGFDKDLLRKAVNLVLSEAEYAGQDVNEIADRIVARADAEVRSMPEEPDVPVCRCPDCAIPTVENKWLNLSMSFKPVGMGFNLNHVMEAVAEAAGGTQEQGVVIMDVKLIEAPNTQTVN